MKALLALYGKLSRRERLIFVGGSLVLIFALGVLTSIQPAWAQRQKLLREIKNRESERDTLQKSVTTSPLDANAALRKQLDTLRIQLRAADREFDAMGNGLVQPQQMGALLQSLLTEYHGIKLLGLKSLPVTPIGDGNTNKKPEPVPERSASASAPAAAPSPVATASNANEDAWLFRHGVEIRLQGSYSDLLSYVKAVEGMPRRVHWGDLDIDARRSPTVVMTLTIFTVSLEKSWWVL